jgi:hypothetical protein
MGRTMSTPIITTTITTTTKMAVDVVMAIMADSIRLMQGMVMAIGLNHLVGTSSNNTTRKEDVAVTTAANTVFPSSIGTVFPTLIGNASLPSSPQNWVTRT